jgi:hypothetical protein
LVRKIHRPKKLDPQQERFGVATTPFRQPSTTPEEKTITVPVEPKKEAELMAGRFSVGDKVKFRPIDNKSLQLDGTIKEIDEKHPDTLLVTATPDGKNVEVERDFYASADDTIEAD